MAHVLSPLVSLPQPILSNPSTPVKPISSNATAASASLLHALSPAKRVASSPLAPNFGSAVQAKVSKVDTVTSPNAQTRKQILSEENLNQPLEVLRTPVSKQQLAVPPVGAKALSATTPSASPAVTVSAHTPTINSNLPPQLSHSNVKRRIQFGAYPTPTTSSTIPPRIPSPAVLTSQSSAAAAAAPPQSNQSLPIPHINLLGSGSKASSAHKAITPTHKRWFSLNGPATSPSSSTNPSHILFTSPIPLNFDRASPCASPTGSLHTPVASPKSAGPPLTPSSSSSAVDRFIPSRRDLSRAVAFAQSHANDEAYGTANQHDKENLLDAENGKKKNPTAAEKVFEATKALREAEFEHELAKSLLNSPDGMNAQMLSFQSLEDTHANTSAKSSSNTTAAASGKKLRVRKLHFPEPDKEYHANLSTIYRSPGFSAATAIPTPSPADVSNSISTASAAAASSANFLNSPLLSSPLGIVTPSHRRGHSRAASVSVPTMLERVIASRAQSIPNDAQRILDCPGLKNDYYLNLLHWSKTGILAIALESALYLWNSHTSSIEELTAPQDEDGNTLESLHVSSVRWNEDGSTLAVAYEDSTVRLWDAQTNSQLQCFSNNIKRVSCMDWNSSAANPWMLGTGSQDSYVQTLDSRIAGGGGGSGRSNVVQTYQGHREEVCGLAFSLDGTQLASGANDNKLCIWNLKASQNSAFTPNNAATSPHLYLKHHNAAVKALAWCPWQERLLASGGGLADGHIRFCNSLTGSQTHSVDTKSQVCSLQWSRTEKELLSAHGHPDNTLIVWKFPELERISVLNGHTARVLHTGISPDGSQVVSASADETLRFWKIWKPQTKAQKQAKNAWILNSPLHKQIR